MKTKDIVGEILVLSVVVGFFAFLIVLAFVNIPKENKDLVNMLLGAFIVSFTTVISYRFGSSKGSTEKDATIAKQNTDLLKKKDDTISTLTELKE